MRIRVNMVTTTAQIDFHGGNEGHRGCKNSEKGTLRCARERVALWFCESDHHGLAARVRPQRGYSRRSDTQPRPLSSLIITLLQHPHIPTDSFFLCIS